MYLWAAVHADIDDSGYFEIVRETQLNAATFIVTLRHIPDLVGASIGLAFFVG